MKGLSGRTSKAEILHMNINVCIKPNDFLCFATPQFAAG